MTHSQQIAPKQQWDITLLIPIINHSQALIHIRIPITLEVARLRSSIDLKRSLTQWREGIGNLGLPRSIPSHPMSQTCLRKQGYLNSINLILIMDILISVHRRRLISKKQGFLKQVDQERDSREVEVKLKSGKGKEGKYHKNV